MGARLSTAAPRPVPFSPHTGLCTWIPSPRVHTLCSVAARPSGAHTHGAVHLESIGPGKGPRTDVGAGSGLASVWRMGCVWGCGPQPGGWRAGQRRPEQGHSVKVRASLASASGQVGPEWIPALRDPYSLAERTDAKQRIKSGIRDTNVCGDRGGLHLGVYLLIAPPEVPTARRAARPPPTTPRAGCSGS